MFRLGSFHFLSDFSYFIFLSVELVRVVSWRFLLISALLGLRLIFMVSLVAHTLALGPLLAGSSWPSSRASSRLAAWHLRMRSQLRWPVSVSTSLARWLRPEKILLTHRTLTFWVALFNLAADSNNSNDGHGNNNTNTTADNWEISQAWRPFSYQYQAFIANPSRSRCLCGF